MGLFGNILKGVGKATAGLVPGGSTLWEAGSAILGGIQGAKQGAASDKYQKAAIQQAQQQYADRKPARDAAMAKLTTFNPNAARSAGADIGMGANDMRREVIQPRGSERQSGVAADLDRLTGVVGDYNGLGAFQPVATGATDPRTKVADRQLAQAGREVQGARVQGAAPIAGTNLTGARSLAGEAANDVRSARLADDYGRIAAGTYTTGDEAKLARDLSVTALGNVMTGPNRGDIAAETLALFDERSAPGLEKKMRDTVRYAAAGGRMGAGMTTSELGDIFTKHEAERGRLERELANDAAGLTLQDRLSRLDASLTAGGAYRGEDLAEAGFQQGLRNEARSERQFDVDTDLSRARLALDRANSLSGLAGQEAGFAGTERRDAESDRAYDFDLQSTNAGLSLDRASALSRLSDQGYQRGAQIRDEARTERSADAQHRLAERDQLLRETSTLADIESQLFGQDALMRDELRGERAYQYGMGRDQIADAFASQGMDLDVASLLSNIGYGGESPVGALQNASAQSAAQSAATMGGVADLLSQIGRRSAGARSANAAAGAVEVPAPRGGLATSTIGVKPSILRLPSSPVPAQLTM